MIFKSFLLGNLVSLCMKIINSVVVVGLYYGFLTTFSMGPSYLFLLRARVIEEGEEGTEKKVSAKTGFITGQLMMFISIYYAPLHLALGRPHTITVLALPYLLFHFFWNNHKHFFDYGSTTRNSMRNLSIQCVFLNNLIFQLFNHFILPSSILVRLVNIYMFRCNNKILFVTSSFVGWLIGHILFMKWVGLILVWIQQKNSIRSNNYLVSELRNSMARIFSILLFITCVYSLGRIPSPIFTKKLKETSETEESEEETDVEIETTSGTKQEQEGSTEEDPSSSPFSEEKEDSDKIDETEEIRVNGKEKTKDEFHFHFKETCYKNRPVYETFYLDGNQENSKLEILRNKKDKDLFWFEKPLVTILFNYKKRRNRPFRYIKNDKFENAVRKEMSQYFFSTCRSDGKEKISFTYSPSLATFVKMIQRKTKTPLFTIDKKTSSDEVYDHWNFKNKQKKKKLSKECRNRVELLGRDKKFLAMNTFKKKTRLCNDKMKKEYLTKSYDPLLSSYYCGRIQFFYSPSTIKETSIKNYIGMIWINKIHLILIITNYQKFEPKMDTSNRKSFSTEIFCFLNLINDFARKSRSRFNFKGFYLFSEHKKEKMDLEDRIKFQKILFDIILLDPKNKTIRKKSTGIKELSKQVPRWSYKLIDELEQQERVNEENIAETHGIRSRKAKRVVIFTDNQQNTETYNNTTDITNYDQIDEVALIRYSQQSDFRRDIIKGSMRPQRRKTTIFEPFQTNLQSPFFLHRINKFLFFSFDILIKIMVIKWMCKNTEFTISDFFYREEKRKESEKKEENKKEEDKREEKAEREIEIAEAWDSILLAQIIRGCVLVTQSILRKYILLPSLIIAKNIIRMLFFKFPEWSEDLKDWNREMHVKCTYNGVQLSETEFPKNWLTDGLQIKILFPFRLKPWHKYKLKIPHKNPTKKRKKKNDFCFLTVWGMETELPFGSSQKRFSPFEPIFKKLEKKTQELKKNCFLMITNLKERRKFFLNLSNETKHWAIRKIQFLKEKINKLSKSKGNLILLFGFRKVYKLNETKKESIINNQMIHKSSAKGRFMDWTNYSLTEKKMKDLTTRTTTIINQIDKITKEKKQRFITSEINISTNKISYNTKRFKLKSSKNISEIFKKRNDRLIRKFYYFRKILSERLYMNILLSMINIPRVNAQLLLKFKSIRKSINKYLYNNKENKKKIYKTNQNTINFISILKKSLNNNSNICVINKNSEIFFDVSYLSQAYVFYKLSEIKVINLYKYKLRSVLQCVPYYNFPDHGNPLFLKDQIKDYFVAKGLFHSELKDKKFHNYVINQWKKWLKSHYRYKYNLSRIRWSRLIAHKWRNRINQRCLIQNKTLNNWNLHEKTQLIDYEKQNDFKANSLPNQKENFKKHYRYNLLLYKYINNENKKDSYSYGSRVQVNNKQEIFFNYNMDKRKFLDRLGGLPLKNYLAEDKIIDIDKGPNRKFFDWRILHFCLRRRVHIESWADTETKPTKNTNTKTNTYQIIDKIDKKNLFFLTIYQDQEINLSNKKKLFDWMGMNEEIVNHPISDLELWFFKKLVIFYNTYERNPWEIPIQLLLFNFNVNRNENVSETKKINRKKNDDLSIFQSILSNAKKSIELENRNHKERGYQDQVALGLVLTNQEQGAEEDYDGGSDIKKRRKKKQYKNNAEAELDFFLKRYLRFQLRWAGSLNQKIINNIKVYCLLLRLTNPREIIISFIQRGDMSLDILLIQKDLTLTEFMKRGILIIEPVRLSVKKDGQFIMYQTVGILLVHKNQQQIYKRYREKNYVDKKNFTKLNDYDLLVSEKILSPQHHRELRILIYFNSKKKKDTHINTEIFNDINNNIRENKCDHVLDKNQDFDRDKKKRIKLKFFLWPNYRLEDLACMNRYWFNTNNASRFSMLRIHIYPHLEIR
uniref:Protein TIC 214 n=1 Tax=Ixonanthes chinensis TaxID=257781 RepID=A0A5J6XHA3_9ROSI|nr:hypothetical chloroplast RF19 [Ixonanthes chinensis]